MHRDVYVDRGESRQLGVWCMSVQMSNRSYCYVKMVMDVVYESISLKPDIGGSRWPVKGGVEGPHL